MTYNGKIGDLQVLHAVDVETFVDNTVLDDGVALLWTHGASTQTVPSRLDVALWHGHLLFLL